MDTTRTKPRLTERLEALRLREESVARRCSWPGCAEEGSFRAPRSRTDLRSFIWFCLEHVREYNRSWNYFAEMTQEEIDAHRRADTTWHRPSWRFGGGFGNPMPDWQDLFGLFKESRGSGERGAPPPVEPRTRQMMQLMGVAEGFTLVELKERYKILAKRHHPDMHGGDPAAEARFKEISAAYAHLRRHLSDL